MAKALKSSSKYSGGSGDATGGQIEGPTSSHPMTSGPKYPYNVASEDGNVKLCRLVDAAYEKIQELQALISKEQRLTGFSNSKKAEALEPVLRKQEQLLYDIEQLQKSKQRMPKFAAPPAIRPTTWQSVQQKNPVTSSELARELCALPRILPSPPPSSSFPRGLYSPRVGANQTTVFEKCPSLNLEEYSERLVRSVHEKDTFSVKGKDENVGYRGLSHTPPYGRAQDDFKRDVNYGFEPMRRPMASELQPDQKYKKRTSSNYAFGLPTIGEVPVLPSKLTPIKATLMPNRRSPKRDSRMHPTETSTSRKSRCSIGPLPESMEKVPSIDQVVSPSDSMNDSDLSFHTAYEDDSLLDFDLIEEELDNESAACGTTMDLITPMNNLNLKGSELDANSNLPLETTKPFEMSDFYKYSDKWRKYLNTSSPGTIKYKTDRLIRRRSNIVTEFTNGSFGVNDGEQQNRQMPDMEPPLPPRTNLPRKPKVTTEAVNNNAAWVMDTPTIV